MSLGEKVKEKRENRGMTQKELAQASGISQATISRLESGRVKQLKSQALRRLADALAVTIDYLVVDKADKLTVTEIALSDLVAQDILRACENLSSARRRQLRDFARFLEQEEAEERAYQRFRERGYSPTMQPGYRRRWDPAVDWFPSASREEAMDRARILLRDLGLLSHQLNADETMTDLQRALMSFIEDHEASETMPGQCSCPPETHLGNDPSTPG